TAKLEEALTHGVGAIIVWSLLALVGLVVLVLALVKKSPTGSASFASKRLVLILGAVALVIAATAYANKATRVKVDNSPAGFAQDPVKSIGIAAPDFTLKDLNGREVSLSEYKGKVVLVNFWATWCTPCLGEIPELIEMQQKYGPKGFVILGLAMDEE